jgi:hypothetical protein
VETVVEVVGFDPEVVVRFEDDQVPAAPGLAVGAVSSSTLTALKPSTSTIMIQAEQPVAVLLMAGPGTAVDPFVLKVVRLSAWSVVRFDQRPDQLQSGAAAADAAKVRRLRRVRNCFIVLLCW